MSAATVGSLSAALVLGLADEPGYSHASWSAARGGGATAGQPVAIVRTPDPPVPFAAGSPFNEPIPPGAAIDPRSRVMVRSLVRSARQGFSVAWRRWSVPVYFVDQSTPRRTVRFTAPWRPARAMRDVPIPPGAQPDPMGDGTIAIVDRSTSCEFDFWQLRRRGREWTASWGNSISTAGTGVFPNGYSARASGFALTLGLLWPEEMAAGSVNHALQFAYDFTKSGGPVAPATESDGVTRSRAAIPIGARVRLDPALDLSTLGLARYEMVVARALQNYGMILVDSGGGLSVYARGPRGAPPSAWRGLLPGVNYPPLDRIPVSRLQVMATGPQQGHPETRLHPSGCGRMTGTTAHRQP